MRRVIKTIAFLCLSSAALKSTAQKDSIFSFHFQQTLIPQYHPKFHAPYTGENSLERDEKTQTSLTNTLYVTAQPWQNTLVIVNPEIAGGTGLSSTTGMAGFPNGEIFRVGNPKPSLYLARLIIEWSFPFTKTTNKEVVDNANTVKEQGPVNYFKLYGGRFCLADYFDDNPYSHDPRSQFMNWSFMSGGAWDYAADTRGYTWGFGGEWKRNDWRGAVALAMMPKKANYIIMDSHIGKAFATQAEVTHFHRINGREGQLQATIFFNKAKMGNYREAIKLAPSNPDVTATANYKNHKWGWVLNGAQQFSKKWGGYARLSWNDGKNETWAFTEIDQSANIGVQWNQSESDGSNVLGIGVVANGLSKPHRDYLAAGGYGFIVGDGRLNYAPEYVAEIYYRFNLFKSRLQLSPDYQFAINPAYNKDRGPVHIFALRTHVEF